jgi:hypothetical protein
MTKSGGRHDQAPLQITQEERRPRIIRPSALPLGDRAARNGCQCIGCGNPSRQRRCTPASEPSGPRSSLRLTRREQTEDAQQPATSQKLINIVAIVLPRRSICRSWECHEN